MKGRACVRTTVPSPTERVRVKPLLSVEPNLTFRTLLEEVIHSRAAVETVATFSEWLEKQSVEENSYPGY